MGQLPNLFCKNIKSKNFHVACMVVGGLLCQKGFGGDQLNSKSPLTRQVHASFGFFLL